MNAALLILKPDVLTGPFARCSGALARDTVRGLLTVYGDDLAFEVPTTAGAVKWALSNIDRKADKRAWYVKTLHNEDAHLAALRDLVDDFDEDVSVAELVLRVTNALGFTESHRTRKVCTRRDFLGLYADNTHFTRLAGSLHGYLVGNEIEVVLLDGGQELTSLHIFKEMLRRVVRYPTTHYDAVENLVHVSDPGARDWTYFAEVVAS